MKGGSRNEPAAKAGLVDLYGATWRTSGTAKQDGDKLDDILEAKAAKVETGRRYSTPHLSAWNCLKQDEDQVFGIVVDLLLHPAFNDQKLKLTQAADGRRHRPSQPDSASQHRQTRSRATHVYGLDQPLRASSSEIATVMSVTDCRSQCVARLAPSSPMA